MRIKQITQKSDLNANGQLLCNVIAQMDAHSLPIFFLVLSFDL